MIRPNVPFIAKAQMPLPSGEWGMITEQGDPCLVRLTGKNRIEYRDRVYVTPSRLEGDVWIAAYDCIMDKAPIYKERRRGLDIDF
jgi:hypothetical protein